MSNNNNLKRAVEASLANAAKREAAEREAAIKAVEAVESEAAVKAVESAEKAAAVNSNAALAAALAADFAAQNAAAQLKREEREDCSNRDLYFENRADGNCLFDSIAQIYKPIDISTRPRFNKEVKPISDKLRALLAIAYIKASEGNLDFNTKYQFPVNNQITGLDGENRSFIEYSKFISKNAAYATDDDLVILTKLLGDISLRVIEQVDVGEQIIPRYIDRGDSSYYTFCNNRGGTHWVLKKGGNPRDFTTDYTNAAGILGILSDKNIDTYLSSQGYNSNTRKIAMRNKKSTNSLVNIEAGIAARVANAANANAANANAANANAANANVANIKARLDKCERELKELKPNPRSTVASRLRAKVAEAKKGGNKTRRRRTTLRR